MVRFWYIKKKKATKSHDDIEVKVKSEGELLIKED